MPLGLTFQQVATIYAAVVATAGLTWQVWAWRRARRPAVVRPSLVALGFDSGTQWVVAIEVVNHRDHAIQVSTAGLLMPDGRDWVATRPLAISTLPGEVKGHDAARLYVSLAAVEETFDLRNPLRAWATLSTHDRVKSKPVRLVASDFQAGSIAEHLAADLQATGRGDGE